jgi:uridine phosphorylase
MPVASRLLGRWKAWVDGGAICSEMEAAAIFIISSIQRVRAGGVMLMASSPDLAPKNEEERKAFEEKFNVDRAIRTAIEGLKVLIVQDRQQK